MADLDADVEEQQRKGNGVGGQPDFAAQLTHNLFQFIVSVPNWFDVHRPSYSGVPLQLAGAKFWGGARMNVRALLLIGAVVLGTSTFTAVSSSSGSDASPEFRFIKAGSISQNGDEFTLVGRFMVTPDYTGTGLENRSHGTGGACIFGDLAKLGAPERTCTSSAVCNQAWSTYYQANLSNPNFNGAAFGSVGNGQCIKGRCWYRPGTGADLCQRNPSAIWPIGVHEIKPPRLQHVADFFGADTKIDWQVSACANRAQSDGTDAPSCANSVGIYHPGLEPPSHPSSDGWDAYIRTPPTSD